MKNIALVPGVLGFERIGPVHYFNGVAEDLNATYAGRVHAEPFTTKPLGTVAERAKVLADQITAKFGGEPVHIFAHSMGGLDARFLVAQHTSPAAEQVKSITAIGTPHNGSPVATLLNKLNPLDGLTHLVSLFPRVDSILEELKTNFNALHDLSEEQAAAFNARCPDQPGVKYHEVVGLSRVASPHTSVPFRLPFGFLHSRGLDSDGVVPVTSATRPGRGPLESWPGDHADLVGHDLDHGATGKPAFFDHLAAHRRLVEKVVL
jgi:triacylglycerol lipase